MSSQKKSIAMSLLCNLFHYYAFSVYAFSAVILSPIFFHTEDAELTKILGLITFSITFVLKPLGNGLFGHIGDRYGRKKALIYSLLAITLATTGIGLIPSYAQIGWFSSAFLILCVVVQGLCVGGQYTGAIIYIQEQTKKEYAALACGLMVSIGVFGTLLGTGVSYLFDNTNELGWVWRIPFLLSSILGLSLYFFMQRIEETPIFMKSVDKAQNRSVPLLDILRNYKRPLFSAIFISCIPMATFYLAAMYIPNFYVEQGNAAAPFSPLSLVCLTQVLCMLLAPCLGFMGDKLGRERQLMGTSILLVVSPVFMFYYMTTYSSLSAFTFGIILFSLFASLYSGPGPAYLSEIFPVVRRYSGMGLGIAIGEGLGGLSPMICVGLERFSESKMAPAYFVMFLGVLSIIGILLSNGTFPLKWQHKKRNVASDKREADKYAAS